MPNRLKTGGRRLGAWGNWLNRLPNRLKTGSRRLGTRGNLLNRLPDRLKTGGRRLETRGNWLQTDGNLLKIPRRLKRRTPQGREPQGKRQEYQYPSHIQGLSPTFRRGCRRGGR